MTTKRSAGAERLRKARRVAAKELKLPVDSWQVKRFALLAVAHENITNRLAVGGDVRIDDLINVDQQMQEIRASLPPDPIEVKLTVVKKLASEVLPLPPDTTPPDNTPTPTPPTDTKPEAPAAPTTNNVVQLPPRLGVSDSAFHDRVLPNGEIAPLKNAQAVYSSPAHCYFGPGVLSEPAPDWSAHHPLPTPGGDR